MYDSKISSYVIKRRNLAEADKILTLFTDQRGKIAVLGKGLRKISSKLAGNLEPFILSEIRLAKGRNMDTIISVIPKRLFSLNQQNLQLIATGYLFLEMVDKLLPYHQPNIKVFNLLTETFYSLEKETNLDMVKQYFYLKMLQFIGHQPNLSPVRKSSIYYFSLKEGNLIDSLGGNQTEGLSTLRVIDQKVIKFWRLLLGLNLDQAMKIRIEKELITEAQHLLDDFYHYQFNVSFKSSALIN